jgi:hypothetical protein
MSGLRHFPRHTAPGNTRGHANMRREQDPEAPLRHPQGKTQGRRHGALAPE